MQASAEGPMHVVPAHALHVIQILVLSLHLIFTYNLYQHRAFFFSPQCLTFAIHALQSPLIYFAQYLLIRAVFTLAPQTFAISRATTEVRYLSFDSTYIFTYVTLETLSVLVQVNIF
jgi:hypothetical protein